MNSKYRLTVSSASFTMCTPVAEFLISIKVYFLRLTREKTLAAALQEHWHAIKNSLLHGCKCTVRLGTLVLH